MPNVARAVFPGRYDGALLMMSTRLLLFAPGAES
jgi:hypothetical protein